MGGGRVGSMRRRIAGAVFLGVLLHGAGSCPAGGQDIDGCEPVTVASVTAVADRLSLDDEQLGWLRTRLGQDRLREPDDLDGMPGMGSELRDLLAASFCWVPSWAGRIELSGRSRPQGSRREGRTRLVRGTLGLAGRFRWDSGGRPILRGAVTHRRGGWSGTIGTLQVRRALGLLLVTPGAEPRGSAPIQLARNGWRSSTTRGRLGSRHGMGR
jgi:hypothetical protein